MTDVSDLNVNRLEDWKEIIDKICDLTMEAGRDRQLVPCVYLFCREDPASGKLLNRPVGIKMIAEHMDEEDDSKTLFYRLVRLVAQAGDAMASVSAVEAWVAARPPGTKRTRPRLDPDRTEELTLMCIHRQFGLDVRHARIMRGPKNERIVADWEILPTANPHDWGGPLVSFIPPEPARTYESRHNARQLLNLESGAIHIIAAGRINRDGVN
jgi:hypothetical protein